MGAVMAALALTEQTERIEQTGTDMETQARRAVAACPELANAYEQWIDPDQADATPEAPN
jgi:hypothetical protein